MMLDGISNLNADSFMKKNYRMTKIYAIRAQN
jgi:hypothetical protein